MANNKEPEMYGGKPVLVAANSDKLQEAVEKFKTDYPDIPLVAPHVVRVKEKKVKNEAFKDDGTVCVILLHTNVETIGEGAFKGCTGLTSINIPDSVTEIGRQAFSGCTGLTSINIPDSVTEIGRQAFHGCTGLTSINTPNSVTKIGGSAFRGCTGLTSINISNSVTEIRDSTFKGCTGLTSINIPNSMTKIGSAAFSGCTGLTSINIPESVNEIGDEVFSDCPGLISIKVDPANTKYYSRETLSNGSLHECDAIIETDSNCLIQGCRNTIPPKSLTKIGKSAFSGCTGLKMVGWWRADLKLTPGAIMLRRLRLPKEDGPRDQRTITFYNNVTEIGERAFEGCTGLDEISLPDSVTKIGGWAFHGCTELKEITVTDAKLLTNAGLPEGVNIIERK